LIRPIERGCVANELEHDDVVGAEATLERSRIREPGDRQTASARS
jgi:hypothetical protein